MFSKPEPSSKTARLDLYISVLTGKSRELQLAHSLCMTCDGDAIDFRDELSQKEYTISGMCQVCQDKVFGVKDVVI